MTKATIGHNSGQDSMLDDSDAAVSRAMSSSIAAEPLRLFIERIERMEEEKKGISDDIRDVYSEAKGQGYDPKIMRKIVTLRKMEKNDRDELDALMDTYRVALGLA